MLNNTKLGFLRNNGSRKLLKEVTHTYVLSLFLSLTHTQGVRKGGGKQTSFCYLNSFPPILYCTRLPFMLCCFSP